MRLYKVKEIPQGHTGVEEVRVAETPDPSVFNDLEYEVLVSHIAGSNKQLGGNPGGPFTLHIFTDSAGCVIFNTGVVQFVVADHAV